MDLELLSYGEAAEMIAREVARLREDAEASERSAEVNSNYSEWMALQDARGRILAQRILADRDQPAFARSTRDGYALRVGDLLPTGTTTTLPIAGSTRAGEAVAELPPGSSWEILTGATIPRGADAVVMQEHVEVSGERVCVNRALKAGENIVQQGAEARAGDLLLAPGTLMGAAELALAASCGYTKMRVRARPRVLILTTGDELVEPEIFPQAGQIRNSNATLLRGLAEEAGAEAIVLPSARDEDSALDDAIEAALKTAANFAGKAPVLLVIAGGVSVGRFDLVESALARRKARFHFTGVAIQPGKPVVFGEMPYSDADGDEGPLKFFGLPGNPVSAAVTFRLFVEPVISALAGSKAELPRFWPARIENAWVGKAGLTRFLPAVSESSAMGALDAPMVRLVAWQGSGDLAAFARSNCLVVIPAESSGIEAGEKVMVLLR